MRSCLTREDGLRKPIKELTSVVRAMVKGEGMGESHRARKEDQVTTLWYGCG